MPERWQEDLKRLRSVEPSGDLWQRAQLPPSGDPLPPPRQRIAAAAVALAVFGAVVVFGWVAIRSGPSRTDVVPVSPRPSTSPSPKASPTPSASGSASTSPARSPSSAPTSPTATGASTDLANGRHLVIVKAVTPGSVPLVTFDLLELLTGSAAQQAAAAGSCQLVNGSCVVDASSRLRQLPLAPDATITYVPAGGTASKSGNVSALVAAATCAPHGDLPYPLDRGWYVDVRDGRIVGLTYANDLIPGDAPEAPC